MKTPREALDLARRYWAEVPVRVFDLARDLELGPQLDPTLPSKIAGKIVRLRVGVWQIYVNANHPRARQRFTVAHEIGHFIYHRELLAAGVSDTLAYRADDIVLPNSAIGPQQEWQANNFAANLLVPDSFLTAAQASGRREIGDLARLFDVSDTTIRIKLGLPIPLGA